MGAHFGRPAVTYHNVLLKRSTIWQHERCKIIRNGDRSKSQTTTVSFKPRPNGRFSSRPSRKNKRPSKNKSGYYYHVPLPLSHPLSGFFSLLLLPGSDGHLFFQTDLILLPAIAIFYHAEAPLPFILLFPYVNCC